MDWDDLIEETARRAGLDREETLRVLDSLFDAVIDKMATEETVRLREDFGYFEMRDAGGSESVHPRAVTKCRRTPVFKKAGALKKKLRQSDEEYCQMLRGAGREAQAERLCLRAGARRTAEK